MADTTAFLGVGPSSLATDPANPLSRAFWDQAREAVQDHGGKIITCSPQHGLLASSFPEFEPVVATARQLSAAFDTGTSSGPAFAATVEKQPPAPLVELIATTSMPTTLVSLLGASSSRQKRFYEQIYGWRFIDLLRTVQVLGDRPMPGRLALIGADPVLRSALAERLIEGLLPRVAGVSSPIHLYELHDDPSRSRRSLDGTTAVLRGLSCGLGPSKAGLGAKPAHREGSGGAGPTGGGSSSGPPSPPSSLPSCDRFLEARFVDRVRLGEVVTLQARIRLTPGANSSIKLRKMNVPPAGLRVLLVLHTPGFEALEGNQAPLEVPPKTDSDPVPFRLRAVREGVHRLILSCYAAGGFVGELELEVIVDRQVTASTSREHRSGLDDRFEDTGDVTMQIFKEADGEGEVYRLQWIDASLNLFEPETSPLRTTPKQAIESLIDKMNKIARGDHGYSPAQVRRLLRAEGFQLWNEFIPESLKQAFWQRRSEIKRLYIRATDDLVPWELLYPLDPGNRDRDHGFLAEQFPIAHLPFGPAPAKQFNVRKACFVAPEKTVERAAEIADLQRRIEKKGGRAGTTITDLDALLGTLDNGGFDVLHFACHNQIRGGDPSTIEIDLDGAGFGPVLLGTYKGHFCQRAPLVFLNACRTNVETPRYIEPFGWATSFLNAGAGAFIGTLWEVRDTTAKRFAETFYTELLGGHGEPQSLGGAFQAARKAIADDPGDPTSLAYTLYGDLSATVTAEAKP